MSSATSSASRATRSLLAASAACVLALAFGTPVHAQSEADLGRACAQGKEAPAAAVAACSSLMILVVGAQDLAVVYDNRGYARLETGDFAGAEADFDEALTRSPGMLVAEQGRGRARVLRGAYADAVADLTLAWEANHDDVFGSLWLFVAQKRAGIADAHPADGSLWPKSLLLFVTGKQSAQETMAQASSPDDAHRPLRVCLIGFVVSEDAVATHASDARRWLELTAQTCPAGQLEGIATRTELQRLP